MTPGSREHKTREQRALRSQKGWEQGVKGAGAGSEGGGSREQRGWEPGASTTSVTPLYTALQVCGQVYLYVDNLNPSSLKPYKVKY
jgi:hypothetical protein